jgi:hypothetical protein
VQLRENSWSFAAITVFGSALAMAVAMVILSLIFGIHSWITRFGSILVGVMAGNALRLRLTEGTWRFFKRADHF